MIVLVAAGAPLAPGGRLRLDDDEAHHLRVRRIADGAQVAFRDGEGAGGTGRVVLEARHASLEVSSVERREAPSPVVLAVGAGDRDRFGWVVEKAAELGATSVVPLETERTASVGARVRAPHVERLARRAREALKQSGGFWAPTVAAPVAVDAFLAGRHPGAGWLLDAAGGRPATLAHDEPVTLMVGPEGGFTAAEVRMIRDAGFDAVRAGPHVLRFETAAVAALTLVHAAREGNRHA